MPIYRVTARTYYKDRLYQAGDEVAVPDGEAPLANATEVRSEAEQPTGTRAALMVQAAAAEVAAKRDDERRAMQEAAEAARARADAARGRLQTAAAAAAQQVLSSHEESRAARLQELDAAQTAIRRADGEDAAAMQKEAEVALKEIFDRYEARADKRAQAYSDFVAKWHEDDQSAAANAEASAHAAALSVLNGAATAPSSPKADAPAPVMAKVGSDYPRSPRDSLNQETPPA